MRWTTISSVTMSLVVAAGWGCSSSSGPPSGNDSPAMDGSTAAGMDATSKEPDASASMDGAPSDAGSLQHPEDGGDAVTPDTGIDGPMLPDGGCTPSMSLTYDGGTPLGCATKPSDCCYPDDTNTGVPTGMSLAASGSLNIQTAGMVISDLNVTGTIDIYANNVTIKNTMVTTSSSGSYAVAVRPGITGTVIQDTTIRGQDNDTNSVEYAIFNISNNPVSVARVNLYNCSECIIGSPTTVVDSYIHDTADPSGAHVENIYGYAGTVLTHNTMFNSVSQTAVVYLDPGPSNGCTITDNFFAGGGYTIYGGSSSGQSSSNVVIKNNRFSKMYYPNSGYYGVDAYFSANGSGDAWSGNFWDETAAPVNP